MRTIQLDIRLFLLQSCAANRTVFLFCNSAWR